MNAMQINIIYFLKTTSRFLLAKFSIFLFVSVPAPCSDWFYSLQLVERTAQILRVSHLKRFLTIYFRLRSALRVGQSKRLIWTCIYSNKILDIPVVLCIVFLWTWPFFCSRDGVTGKEECRYCGLITTIRGWILVGAEAKIKFTAGSWDIYITQNLFSNHIT